VPFIAPDCELWNTGLFSLGGASVIRNWGGIGTGGQSMVETFDQSNELTRN